MANDNGVPNYEVYADHPEHLKAKMQKLRGKPRVMPDPKQSTVVTCPECGVTFDSNYTKEDGEQ